MFVIFLSLLAALLFGCHAFFVKLGLTDSDPMSATLVSTSINCLFLLLLTFLFVPFSNLKSNGLIYLIIAGFIAPCLARIFLYTGIDKMGVSIASPIRSTYPFFSIIPAIVFLNERFTLGIAIATFVTVFGVILISMSSSDAPKITSQLQWNKRDLIYPFSAAVCYGISNFLKKTGMNVISSPIFGATIVATVSLLFLIVIFISMKKKARGLSKKNVLLFSLGGVSASLAQISMFAAFRNGELIVIGPASSTTPLFVLILTYLFLKETERINLTVVFGVIAIVSGVIILKSMT